MEDLKNKIVFYMKSKNISYARLAELTGITKSSLQRYATGTTLKIPVDAIAKIENALEIPKGTLLGWDSEPNTTKDMYGLRPITKKKIPMLGEIACGQPIYCNENYETYAEVDGNLDADFCLTAKGDSMINARIFDGDIVFVKKQSYVDNGEIAVVVIDDSATLKRVYKYDNRLELRAENPTFSSINIEGAEIEKVVILGKAVAFQSYVR